MTTKTTDYNDLIKNNIKCDHSNKLYKEDDLPNIINSIKEYILKHHDVDDFKLTLEITQYLYYSSKDTSFYFNSNKKQSKLREYHNKILKKINIFVDTDIKIEEIEDIKIEEIKTEVKIDKCITNNMVDINIKSTQIEENVKEISINKSTNVPSLSYINNIVYNPNNLVSNPPTMSSDVYVLPKEQSQKIIKRIQHEYEPFGTDWIHDEQLDDPEDDFVINNRKQYDKLRAVVLPEQRTPAWYEARDKCITASDCSQAMGNSKYNPQYEFILKKTTDKIPFIDNKYVHHGKKYEDIANLIYNYRLNVDTGAFGLMPHPTYSFLGASPDAIVSKYKYDKIHKTKYVGTMVEIKCIVTRTILTYHDVVEELGTTDIPYEVLVEKICPKVYFDQIQLQLETCDLEYCHFWQCNINEYDNFEEFVEDTDPDESFRSKETKFEKGCLIQLLPKNWVCNILRKKYDTLGNKFKFPDEEEIKKIIGDEYEQTVISSSKYIYPPAIEMSPYDCQLWINTQLEELKSNPDYNDYVFDRVIYWKLIKSSCLTIKRDKEWFNKSLPILERIWSYVTFLREHKDILDIFCDYIDTRLRKVNKQIMDVLDKLCNSKSLDDPCVKEILQDINEKKERDKEILIHVNSKEFLDGKEFVDNKKPKIKTIKKVTSIPKSKVKKDPDYMFEDDDDDDDIKIKNTIKKVPTTKQNIKIKDTPRNMFDDDNSSSTYTPNKKVVPTRQNKKISTLVNPEPVYMFDDL